jgi:hypothetical protein
MPGCVSLITLVCAPELKSAARFMSRISFSLFTLRNLCISRLSGLALPLDSAAASSK